MLGGGRLVGECSNWYPFGLGEDSGLVYLELLSVRLLYPTANKRHLVALVKWERYSHRMESK